MEQWQRRAIGVLSGLVVVVFIALVFASRNPEDNPVAVTPTLQGTDSAASSTVADTTPDSTTTTTNPSSSTTLTTIGGTETTTTFPTIGRLIIKPGGIGNLPLGTSDVDAIGGITAVLGEPDEDSGWVDATSSFGVCPGTIVRLVRWGTLSLYFSDGPTQYGGADQRHLFSYFVAQTGAPLGLETETGVKLGTTVRELEKAYGDGVSIVEDEFFGSFFNVATTPPDRIWGYLSGTGKNDIIESIIVGVGCGE